MRKHIIALVALGIACTASSVLGQGQLNYSIRVTGSIVGHVYDTRLSASQGTTQISGNTAAETQPGSQTYDGPVLQGTGFSAQLWAANGAGQAIDLLTPVAGSIVGFRSGATLGGTIVPLTLDIAQVPVGGTGTFMLRAWDNAGGTITSYAEAAVRGQSALFNVASLTTNPNIPPNMAEFQSFNIYAVPEPSTFILAGLGAASLLIFRRRK